ncbi:hypothetical protein CDG77_15190, partial [Nostoc sp. 'Peltigera membranacea cyanobiont' 213]|uniref:hypothetical protein n=1 Tax=Nostoc sp. 'Peltigera membranacea cyanobiont' 213 TaxID=2014530 RepID=UPI000B9F7968
QPLPACGEGRQSIALAGWGSFLMGNLADYYTQVTQKRTTEAQRSQCALVVPRLVRAASPTGEATGATRRNPGLRDILRKSYLILCQ